MELKQAISAASGQAPIERGTIVLPSKVVIEKIKKMVEASGGVTEVILKFIKNITKVAAGGLEGYNFSLNLVPQALKEKTFFAEIIKPLCMRTVDG